MINLTSVISAVRGASLAAKIGLGVGAVAVVTSGTVGAVVIINNVGKTPETQQVASGNQNDNDSSSEQSNTQVGETGEPEDEEKDDQPADETEPSGNSTSNNSSQTTTKKPNSNTSNKPSPSKPSTSEPSTSTTQPSTPAPTPAKPAQPSQPSQPSKPAQPAKKPDYNLNDNYMIAYCFAAIGGNTSNFYAVGKTSESATSACVAKMISNARKHSKYSNMSDDDIFAEIGGGGYSGQLTEAECSKNGLSCGRW